MKVRINNMGTIRNRVVIVHHYRKEEIEEIRNDAVVFFKRLYWRTISFLNMMSILKWLHP